eukprot:Amastigsp_a340038_90.p5 type:complete len:101 gc:universal Amastigsp_a340038_90:2149-2451(+)
MRANASRGRTDAYVRRARTSPSHSVCSTFDAMRSNLVSPASSAISTRCTNVSCVSAYGTIPTRPTLKPSADAAMNLERQSRGNVASPEVPSCVENLDSLE